MKKKFIIFIFALILVPLYQFSVRSIKNTTTKSTQNKDLSFGNLPLNDVQEKTNFNNLLSTHTPKPIRSTREAFIVQNSVNSDEKITTDEKNFKIHNSPKAYQTLMHTLIKEKQFLIKELNLTETEIHDFTQLLLRYQMRIQEAFSQSESHDHLAAIKNEQLEAIKAYLGEEKALKYNSFQTRKKSYIQKKLIHE